MIRRLFQRLRSCVSNDIGIDLGTANCLVFLRGQGVVCNEPSVVAVAAESGKVLAAGRKAYEMLGRVPVDMRAVRPMKEGVIADFEVTEEMLRYFVKKVRKKTNVMRPRLVVAVPTGITEVELKAVEESAKNAGCREVITVYEPMAAAIGVGLPVSEPCGNMIVDIGGGTTEVAVLSLNGIVESRSIRVGGDAMDQTIVRYLKRSYSLVIGERTAERIKIQIGSATPLDEEITMDVNGRDLNGGLPRTVSITSAEVRECLIEPVSSIAEAVRINLEHCPPELASDLIDHGVVLAGGGALLRNLDKLLAEETGLPITIADDPMSAVANGTGIYLENLERYQSRLN